MTARTSNWLGLWAARLGLILAAARIAIPTLAAQAAPPAFAAVSIRPSQPRVRMQIQSDPAGLRMTGVVLRQMVVYAYGVHDYQLTGEGVARRSRSWMLLSHYDVDATTSAPATDAQIRLMLRGVLRDRFGLQISSETNSTAVRALVIAPGGIKFTKAGAERFTPTPGMMAMRMQTTEALVSRLNSILAPIRPGVTYQPIVDATGLKGNYNIVLLFPIVSRTLPNGGRQMTIQFSALPQALKREGLALKPETIPFETYTIVSAHEPTGN